MISKEIKGQTRGKRGDMSRIEQEQRRKTKKDKGPVPLVSLCSTCQREKV